MYRPSRREIHRLLDVVAVAASSRVESPFGPETLDALVEAIPADEAAYVEYQFDAPSLAVWVSRAAPAWDEEAIEATCSSYPLKDRDHAGSQEPLRISDLVSGRTLRRSPFYAAVMRPSGMEYELKLWLSAPAGQARYFELERAAGRDFSERERDFLSVLKPHLEQLRSRWQPLPLSTVLTDREREVLALAAEGLTNKQISARLCISAATVRTHLEHIYDKLGVRTRAGAVGCAPDLLAARRVPV